MSTVVVTAVFTPREGSKDDLITALHESIPAVHAEQGCELYAIHDAADGTIVMIEKWTSEADLDTHAAGKAVEGLDALIAPHIAQPVIVTRMTALPAGSREQGTL